MDFDTAMETNGLVLFWSHSNVLLFDI